MGDYYDNEWKGGSERRTARKDTFEELSVTGRAFANVGEQFGGKSPMQIRLEQMNAARRANSAGFSGN